jgi:hypothetical protein
MGLNGVLGHAVTSRNSRTIFSSARFKSASNPHQSPPTDAAAYTDKNAG